MSQQYGKSKLVTYTFVGTILVFAISLYFFGKKMDPMRPSIPVRPADPTPVSSPEIRPDLPGAPHGKE